MFWIPEEWKFLHADNEDFADAQINLSLHLAHMSESTILRLRFQNYNVLVYFGCRYRPDCTVLHYKAVLPHLNRLLELTVYLHFVTE